MDTDLVRDQLRDFARERGWERFHTPRNLLLALVGEVGELAELMQWESDDAVAHAAKDPDRSTPLAAEVADIAIYLIRVADVLQIDLAGAVDAKLSDNARRYPAKQVFGSAASYTQSEGAM